MEGYFLRSSRCFIVVCAEVWQQNGTDGKDEKHYLVRLYQQSETNPRSSPYFFTMPELFVVKRMANWAKREIEALSSHPYEQAV